MARNLTQIFVNKETICRRFRLPLLVLFVRAIFWLMRIIVIRHLHAAHLSPTEPPCTTVVHPHTRTHTHMAKASFYSNWNVFSTGLLSTSAARDTWVLFVFVAGDFLAKDAAKKQESTKGMHVHKGIGSWKH